jgi:hypothetical protein
VHDRKVTLPLHTRLMAGKVIEEQQVGLTPLALHQPAEASVARS